VNGRILLIDDDLEHLKMLRAAMEESGHSVDVGFDGQMALQMARSKRPDLIIMDVNMPMTNGLAALDFLRATPDTRQIPVIFLTSANSQSVYPALEKHQRTTYLKKPVELDELNGIVDQFLCQYPSSRVA
jgi:CheY-like chemotaxis protein